MVVPKEEADALRRCVAILAPSYSPLERKNMSVNIEKHIRGKGATLLCLRFTQFATLFFPNNPQRAEALASQMQQAYESGELTTVIPASKQGALINDLIVWPDCPPIPSNSPLRYWFPESMYETEEVESEKRKHVPKQRKQELAILDWLKEKYGNPKELPKPPKGKAGPRAAAWDAMKPETGLFQSKNTFEKAWDRLRASKEIQD